MKLEYPIKQIGQYAYSLKNSLLGQTKNSRVYQGIDTFSNEPVAIKVIQLSKMNQLQIKMLYNEIEIMHQLKKSLNIIKVYRVYEAQKQMFIIMQRCNDDLQKLLSDKKINGKGLQESKAIQIMNQIIIGYTKIYQKRIIHRDLKLANIFLKNGRVRIADFGYAIRAKKDTATGMVKTKQNVGSPIYMAPESLNKNIYSFKSDIWALGCIFYQLLFGKQPWNAISQEHLSKQLSTFSLHDKIIFQISQQSYNFLQRTLNKDLEQRFNPQQLVNFSFSSSDNCTGDSVSTSNQSPLIKKFKKRLNYVDLGIKQPIFSQNFNYKFDSKQAMTKNSNFRSPKNETNFMMHTARDLCNYSYNFKQKTGRSSQKKQIMTRFNFASPKASTSNNTCYNQQSNSMRSDKLDVSKFKSQCKLSDRFDKLFLNQQKQKQSSKIVILGTSDRQIDPVLENNITNLLKFQIHFCRFMAKVGERVQILNGKKQQKSDNQLSTLNQDFIQALAAYLIKKSEQIVNLEAIDLHLRQLYREKSLNYLQIYQYASQWHQKFKSQFSWYISKNKSYSNKQKQLLLMKLSQYTENHFKKSQLFYESNIQKWQQQTIFVEYLNTIKETIQLIEKRAFNLATNHDLISTKIEDDRVRIEQMIKKIGQLRKYQISLRQIAK